MHICNGIIILHILFLTFILIIINDYLIDNNYYYLLKNIFTYYVVIIFIHTYFEKEKIKTNKYSNNIHLYLHIIHFLSRILVQSKYVYSDNRRILSIFIKYGYNIFIQKGNNILGCW